MSAAGKAIVARLSANNHLAPDDISALVELPAHRRELAIKERVASVGDKPTECCVVLQGVLARSIYIEEGRRQIVSVHLPGEVPDLQSLYLKQMNHNLTAVTPAVVGLVHHSAMRTLLEQRPTIEKAFRKEAILEIAIAHQWIVNIGARDSFRRTAHFLSEMLHRYASIGAELSEFRIPVPQYTIADCLGMSTVHANRTMQELKKSGVISVERGLVVVRNRDKLNEIGEFDPAYLEDLK